MQDALIQPKLLNWAVERSGRPLEDVARSAHVKLDKLEEWENGKSLPTFRQAINIAQALRIPFGYLFLSSVPDDKIPLPDLRTVRNAEFEEFSLDLIDLINDTLRKQNWYREFLLEEGVEPLEFIGKFDTNDPPDKIAENISTTLGIDDTLREEVNSWGEFLTASVRRAETKGILVLRSGIVGSNNTRKLQVEEFRGFAICDDIAPLIFINGQDFDVAKIFTFAHELAHLWIGQNGISNLPLGETTPPHDVQVEFFCNSIAAELLAPAKRFINEWQRYNSLENNIQRLSQHFRVSAAVILRRAFDLNVITSDEFFANYREELKNQAERIENRKKTGTSGGDFYSTFFARNSTTLSSTIVAATFEGRLPYRDAANLLNVKVKTLEKIAEKLGIR